MSQVVGEVDHVFLEKKELRKRMRSVLKLISSEDKLRQSLLTQEKILQRNEFLESRHVAVYLAMINEEIDTDKIVKCIFEMGKICYVPIIENTDIRFVRLESQEDYETLPRNKWNIREPSPDQKREDAMDHGLDLIITPGLAFDLNKGRLGRGKGYYDRAIKKAKDKFNSLAIGICFNEQIIENVPRFPEKDQLLDDIIFSNQI